MVKTGFQISKRLDYSNTLSSTLLILLIYIFELRYKFNGIAIFIKSAIGVIYRRIGLIIANLSLFFVFISFLFDIHYTYLINLVNKQRIYDVHFMSLKGLKVYTVYISVVCSASFLFILYLTIVSLILYDYISGEYTAKESIHRLNTKIEGVFFYSLLFILYTLLETIDNLISVNTLMGLALFTKNQNLLSFLKLPFIALLCYAISIYVSSTETPFHALQSATRSLFSYNRIFACVCILFYMECVIQQIISNRAFSYILFFFRILNKQNFPKQQINNIHHYHRTLETLFQTLVYTPIILATACLIQLYYNRNENIYNRYIKVYNILQKCDTEK